MRAARPLYLGQVAGPTLTGQIDGTEIVSFSLHPGESLVLVADTPLRLTLPTSARADASFLVLAVDPRKVQGVLASEAGELVSSSVASSSGMSPSSPSVRFSTPPGVGRLLESLTELFASTGPYRETLIDLNASALVVRLLQTEARPLLTGARTSDPPRPTDERLGAAVQYARAHLDQPLSVRDLAEQACMSESSFYRHFREAVGMTPLQFLTHERMQRARQLLVDRTQTVSAVSQEVGFQSVSYFITTFKTHVGQTPKQYQLSATES